MDARQIPGARAPAAATGEPAAAGAAPSARVPEPETRLGGPDTAAIVTIVLVAVIGIAFSWVLPWWIMKARAPQYGQRTLVVMVSPRTVDGDVREVDLLGHYVGIQPMGTLARMERTLAPLGMAATALGIVIAPWLRRRWLRLLAVLPAILLPAMVLVDLKLWMTKAVNERNPDASLNLTVSKINPQLFGEYDVGQFKVATELGSGFYAAGTGALLGLGLIFTAPLPLRRRQATALLAAGLVSSVLVSRAGAAEVVAGGDEGAVAAAIATAREGDTVVVPAGTHREHLVVEKRLRLLGRPGAVIDGGEEGTVLRIGAPGVEVRGLTLRGSGSTYNTEDAGIRIDHAADVRIADVQVTDALFGIFVAQADRCVIEGSTIVGKDLPHVRRGDGIRLWYSSGCRLTGNTIERSRDVIIWYSSDTTIEDNVVRTSRYGLHYMYSNRNAFHRNRFEDNQVGAAIMYSHDIDLSENAFSFSSGPAAYGLLLKDADDVFIVGNRFVQNATALFFDNAPQSERGAVDVRGNLMARNDVGIALQPLSERIRFWENALIGNLVQVQIVGTGTAERNLWSVDGRGNYWSDAIVYDADGDGVSEVPYRLESTYEAMADRYPALALLDTSPAAEAIDAAARLFPIFAPRPKLTDAHPLAKPPLTAWTRNPDARSGGGLMVTGVGLLALAGLCAAGGRWVFA